MSGLAIPEAAYVAAALAHDSANPDSRWLEAVDAAAPIIVAAELRKLAEDPLAAAPKNDNWTSGEVSAWLNRRADELDPPAVTT